MRHQMIRLAAVFLLLAVAGAVSAGAAPVTKRSYVWYGELVSLNEGGKTATIKARIPEYVAKYVDRFKPGDRLVLVWNMIGRTESEVVLALWKYDDVKDGKGGNTGYVLPIEFVSADTDNLMVTFNTAVGEQGAAVLKDAQPGQWLKVTAPMDQPSADAVITSIELTTRPEPKLDPKPEPKPEAKPEKPEGNR